MRVSAPLLSLLGHELRAPAGVLGGYLALLEQDAERLSARQRQALAGARRAQQTLVGGLDDLRRLLLAWQAEDEPTVAIGLPELIGETARIAASRTVPLTIAPDGIVAVPCHRRDTSLAEGLVALAEAVARETGGAVTARVATDDRTITWQFRPAQPLDEPLARRAFDLWRPGLGVRLVTAAVAIESLGGTLDDLWAGDRRAGIDATLPVAMSASGDRTPARS